MPEYNGVRPLSLLLVMVMVAHSSVTDTPGCQRTIGPESKTVVQARQGNDECPDFFDSGQPGSLSHDWSARMAKALPKLEK